VRKNKNPEERKREIIETAKRLFVERGYEETQIKDIVGEIGVAQGLFYYYFKSKAEVFEIIASEYADAIIDEIKELLASNMSARDKIIRIFDVFLNKAESESILFNEIQFVEGGIVHESVFNDLSKKLLPIILKIVEQAISIGEFHCQYPIQTTQIIIYGLLSVLQEVEGNKRIDYLKNNLDAITDVITNTYKIEE